VPESEAEPECANRELEVVNEALRQRIAELEARNKDLEAFSHTVAHDLKAPLCTLAGYTDFLRIEHTMLNASELKRYLERVHRSALGLSDIIDDLLLLAGLRLTQPEIDRLDMAGIVGGALNRLAHRIERDGAQIVSAETWPVAVGYGPWIATVWANYIDNAIKYGGRPAFVELGASPYSVFP
jgi:light-regulated signal transduction histidine kinase (bacteriophytochrome)